MKTWGKLAIGCLVAIVAFCVLSVAAMFFMPSVFKGLFDRFGGKAATMAKDIKALDQFDKEHPFTAPESGEVDEARLQDYIAVAQQVKAAMAPYQDWIQKHKGTHEKGNWKDVGEALSLTGTLVGAMRKGFEERHMTGAEFHWIESEMRHASKETGGEKATDAQRQMVESSVKVLEDQMNAPGTTPEGKAQIQGQIDKLRATLEEAGGPVSHNRELYLKHQKELEDCDLSEFGDIKVK